MIPGRILNATRALGAPKDWDPADGKCVGLAIRDGVEGGLHTMTSAWLPNADELERLNAGAPVYLVVVGAGHPPVRLEVGPVAA